MTLRSLPVALILGIATAHLQAQSTASPTAEKCGVYSNIIIIQVVPCDPPTAAEVLPSLLLGDEKFQKMMDWVPPRVHRRPMEIEEKIIASV